MLNIPWWSVLALVNTAVGAGVLAFPSAYFRTGWAAGLAMTAAVAALEALTLYQLCRLAEKTQSKSYQSLVRSFPCCHPPLIDSMPQDCKQQPLLQPLGCNAAACSAMPCWAGGRASP